MTFVYSLYGADDDLLYVGMTDHIGVRLRCHERERDWWPEVTRVEVHAHADRKTAAKAEQFRIEAYEPKHNIQFLPTRGQS